jgi:hypothetical protein
MLVWCTEAVIVGAQETIEIEMERIVNLHIEKLPEDDYLATSDDVLRGREPLHYRV